MNKETDLSYLSSLNSKFGKTQAMIIQLQQENKKLNMQLDQALKDYDEEMQKNMKAIEYIEYNNEGLYTFETDYDYEEIILANYEPSSYREDLLEILKGDSNE